MDVDSVEESVSRSELNQEQHATIRASVESIVAPSVSTASVAMAMTSSHPMDGKWTWYDWLLDVVVSALSSLAVTHSRSLSLSLSTHVCVRVSYYLLTLPSAGAFLTTLPLISPLPARLSLETDRLLELTRKKKKVMQRDLFRLAKKFDELKEK